VRVHRGHQPAPDHRGHELRRGGLGGPRAGGDLPVAQDGDLVADLHDLLHLVRDQRDRRAGHGHRAQHREQRAHLAGGEHRGRLVEDQHAGVTVQGLEDLDALADAER
jgi:hypothetical protein